jgi:glycosyltransferase involved in cell wall biosynthesis
MKILIIAPYPPGIAPSQRFRFEQYLPYLAEKSWKYDYAPFIDMATWRVLHQPGHFAGKAVGIFRAFLRRLRLLFRLRSYDRIFIHREASHIGPPVFEWLIARVFRKKIIYDFDDAIWLPNFSEHNRTFQWLKYYRKVRDIMRWSHRVSAGNAYLADFARPRNPSVTVIPSTIDTVGLHNQLVPHEDERPVVIGWTGTLTTIKYLQELLPLFRELEQTHDFRLTVIANEHPHFELTSFRFVPWQKEREIADLLTFRIGLMPLHDDIWSRGKCGFKALQYMALGIPPLVSPVGVNAQIVTHGVNGFHCRHRDDWQRYLIQLMEDPGLRRRMGQAARERVESAYSVNANRDAFLGLFE